MDIVFFKYVKPRRASLKAVKNLVILIPDAGMEWDDEIYWIENISDVGHFEVSGILVETALLNSNLFYTYLNQDDLEDFLLSTNSPIHNHFLLGILR